MTVARTGRWLVTGAGGQLGRSLLALGGSTGRDLAGEPRATLDICDREAVARALDRYAPAVVVNAAAYTAVDRAESDFEAALRTNAEGAGVVAALCAGRALLIHVSTEYVFAGEPGAPLREDAATVPLSAYGRSKLRGEEAVREAGGEHLIVRTSWLFGPGPNFVRAILARAASGDPLRVVRDEVGRPTWTGSLAAALFDVAERPIRGTLHLANQGVTNRHEFATAIVEEGARRGWNPQVPVEPIERADLDLPAQRPAAAVLDLGRASEAGVELPPWRAALGAYLDAEEEKRDA